MSKISEGIYFCPWCELVIPWKKITSGKAPNYHPDPARRVKGKKRVSAQLICPKCRRYVKQK